MVYSQIDMPKTTLQYTAMDLLQQTTGDKIGSDIRTWQVFSQYDVDYLVQVGPIVDKDMIWATRDLGPQDNQLGEDGNGTVVCTHRIQEGFN